MNKVPYRLALMTALLPLVVSGYASQEEGAPAEASTAASAPQPPAAGQPEARAALQPGPPSAIEVQTGIQITKVGLTASGGLVDVRFRVLDAAKARALLADPANTPSLVAGDKPPLMAPHNALKGARFSNGQVFFVLYPNVRGAVQAGVPVTVAMGPVQLGPVTAQ
jgi:hypothetical protein